MKYRLKKMFKYAISYPLEAAACYLLYAVTLAIPIEKGSTFIGFLIKFFGKFSKASDTAKQNLLMAYPKMSENEATQIAIQSWESIGRTVGEYSRLASVDIYSDDRFEVLGLEHLEKLRDDGKPGIIFSAHLANWGMAIMAATQRGLRLSQLYRALNNPLVDKIARNIQLGIGQEVLTKGPNDAKRVIDVLRRGDHLFLLLDQKLNEGISVPFFGRDAMTAPAVARLALKFDCPLVPVQVERLDGFKFRITFHPPVDLSAPKSSDAVYEIMCRVNKLIEGWVRQHPGQWLWIHNRWPTKNDRRLP